MVVFPAVLGLGELEAILVLRYSALYAKKLTWSGYICAIDILTNPIIHQRIFLRRNGNNSIGPAQIFHSLYQQIYCKDV